MYNIFNARRCSNSFMNGQFDLLKTAEKSSESKQIKCIAIGCNVSTRFICHQINITKIFCHLHLLFLDFYCSHGYTVPKSKLRHIICTSQKLSVSAHHSEVLSIGIWIHLSCAYCGHFSNEIITNSFKKPRMKWQFSLVVKQNDIYYMLFDEEFLQFQLQ